MTLDEIKKSIEEDFKKIDKLHLLEESTKSTELFGKYANLYTDHRYALENAIFKHKRLYNLYLKIIEGKGTAEENKAYPHIANVKFSTQTARDKFLENEDDLLKLSENIAVHRLKADILREAMDAVKFTRSKSISDAIVMLKFENGCLM